LRRWLKEQWKQIRGNFKYDLLRTLVGGVVFSAGTAIANKMRHIPLDWVVLVVVFVLGVVLLLLLNRRQAVVAAAPPVAANVDLEQKPARTMQPVGLYIELYSPIFIAPKVGDFAFRLLQGKFVASGKNADEATTDCDLLVELYIVNKTTKTIYIRDFAAWIEIAGAWHRLLPDENFDLDDLWSGSVEYGLEVKGGDSSDEPIALTPLLSRRGTQLQPKEPMEGWLKFSVKDINPNLKYPIRIAVIDSVGNEHHIDKEVPKERHIAYRRIGG